MLASGGTVVRLPQLLGEGASADRPPFDAWLLGELRSGRRPKLLVHEVFTPVAADLVAEPMWQLLSGAFGGPFHLAGGEAVTRMEFGERLCAVAGLPADFEPLELAVFDPDGKRPPRLALTCERASEAVGYAPPNLRESLARWSVPRR